MPPAHPSSFPVHRPPPRINYVFIIIKFHFSLSTTRTNVIGCTWAWKLLLMIERWQQIGQAIMLRWQSHHNADVTFMLLLPTHSTQRLCIRIVGLGLGKPADTGTAGTQSWQDPNNRSNHSRQNYYTRDAAPTAMSWRTVEARHRGDVAKAPLVIERGYTEPAQSAGLMRDEDRSLRLVREWLQITLTDCWRPLDRSHCFLAT